MPAIESTTVAVLAEKPSVARDIARVLGATKAGDGYLHGGGYVVTWAIGHLAALAQPHEIRPEWRTWRRDLLPMLPEHWPLVVSEKTQDQFEVVRRILNSGRVSRIVCATDAGREGELIFRYIYEAAHCDKPVSRLWISSLTPDAIRKGFDTLRPSRDYDSLADAARGRSRADWLVGMNLSRAYSLACAGDLSVGRVQTPTLAMLVEREIAIRGFVPEDYTEVAATFHPTGAAKETTYRGTWFRPRAEKVEGRESIQQAARLPADGEEAKRIAGRARTGKAAIESMESQTQRMAPLLLYDLTELQRHANRLYGFSAQKTLDTAQALYERHKLISYPRTDSRHLSQEVARTLPAIVRTIEAPYREHLAPGTGDRPLGRRFVDDAKVTDHHAIIPTTIAAGKVSLSADESKIYDLICRRLLSAWHDDYIWSVTTVITAIRNGETVDRYHTSGSAVQQPGWKVLDVAGQASRTGKRAKPGGQSGAAADPDTEAMLPPGLAKGQPQDVVDAEVLKKKTRPPKRFTEGALLTAMETAGQTLDEKELSEAMKDTGLGTPATRAAIIEVLLKRGYILRSGKALEATDKGIRLIEVVHPEVKSPAMTGQWEAFLARIQRGAAQLGQFMSGIEDYVREVVGKVGQVNGQPGPAPGQPPAIPLPKPSVFTARPLSEILHEAFGFSSFRPNQQEVCQAVARGDDVLLVMPTGSGKSLCYQLPGLARGGTTLVISPLISLMEDQVAKLRERNIAAERIHSGRDRGASREACLEYLNGNLQFLFIAPERLRVPGFPEMLAKRKPALIAIDEAHCISQWGHDFRPDYRMLGQLVAAMRPAPVIAMTATATPIVQDDVAAQLHLAAPARFIRGFRRDNIAIEVVEVAQAQRFEITAQLLRDSTRRPAIVYTPTRAAAESLAAELRADFPSDAYHAGLDAKRRQRVQEEFQAGRIEVMVATIAFGMGIDKPDVRTVIHTALPGSLEAYYQEMGRAGRDGQPSRAILLHSYSDRHTHDFFFERNYPDPAVLRSIFKSLRAEPQERTALQEKMGMDPDTFDRALEKLWIHGGAVMASAESFSRGHDRWQDSYAAQGEQKQQQLNLMLRYVEGHACRMAALVRHFGDFADSQKPCGICDFCAPAECAEQQFRPANPKERDAALRVVNALREAGMRSTGKLHAELFPLQQISRDLFEELLGAMARAGLVQVAEAVFEKEGRTIPYRKASLTRTGYGIGESLPDLFMKAEGRAEVDEGAPAKRKRKKKVTAAGRTKTKSAPPNDTTSDAASARLEEKLRRWRIAEAKRRRVPAFRIFSDPALKAIASRRPISEAELLAIPGIGTATVAKYGAHLYRLCGEMPN